MKLRTYQEEALTKTVEDLKTHDGCLIVMATGMGKTVTLSHIVDKAVHGRVLVIAHREELIHQLSQTLSQVTGKEVGIEMAEWKVENTFWGTKPQIVVATIQSLTANKSHRLNRLVSNPDEWSLTVIDECHHAPAQTYRHLVEHMRQNSRHKVLGVTATPDRLDRDSGGSLASVFDHVSYQADIKYGIEEGWLVPVRQRTVYVKDLDYSSVRSQAGDLNQKQLKTILDKEKVMHMMCAPTLELVGDRRTLFFAQNCDQGRRICEIFNRNKRGCARYVDGDTPKDERRLIFEQYRTGKFQILVNIAVAVEGFDAPEIECVVMGRPTKSRALYTQIVGRGLRPLPGLVDSKASPQERRAAIEQSSKTFCEVIDFHGNPGRHKLVWTGDILGGQIDPLYRDRAREIMEQAEGELVDPDEAVEQARLEHEEDELKKRAAIRAKAKYSTRAFNAFDRCDLGPEIHLEGGPRQSTLQQVEYLAEKTKGRVDASNMTYAEAQQKINDYKRRVKEGLWSWFQEAALRKKGYTGRALSMEEASHKMTQLVQSGFKRRFA